VSEFGTEQEVNAVERVYEPEDISALYVILKLLDERGEVKIIEPAQGARFGIPELPAIPKLMGSISHLRANGLLAYKSESGEARVTSHPFSPRRCSSRYESGNTLPWFTGSAQGSRSCGSLGWQHAAPFWVM
jgi:hypothetical protein